MYVYVDTRVSVHVSVRGVVTGRLKAFDRHMNLVLSEADEVFMLPGDARGGQGQEGGGGAG
jgi:small nuclear ribonucleoprotein (snRNP)-like protein